MSSSRKSAGPAKPGYLDRPYAPGDSIPAPDVVETAGDSGWALWTELSDQVERHFAPTAPASLPMPLQAADAMDTQERGWAATAPAGLPTEARPPAAVAAAAPVLAIDAAMQLARRNNRVCPKPAPWQALYEMLAARRTDPRAPLPPAPATGGAWKLTPPLAKRLCFREQIEWAHRHGLLEALMQQVEALPEGEWLHMGDD